jgi:hypothetical protein
MAGYPAGAGVELRCNPNFKNYGFDPLIEKFVAEISLGKK